MCLGIALFFIYSSSKSKAAPVGAVNEESYRAETERKQQQRVRHCCAIHMTGLAAQDVLLIRFIRSRYKLKEDMK